MREPLHDRLIITAASPGYERSALALVGSLNCNWPRHPPVLVYDLGMSSEVVGTLRNAGVEVRRVPEFCPHWRSDFTWKPWCFRDAPAESYLWLDAGVCVLRPLDEVFESIERMGYFAVAFYNYTVGPQVPRPLMRNAKVPREAVDEMISIASGVHGFRKDGPGLELVEDAYRLALDPSNMRATEPTHRHDQALLTLLLHRYFGPPVLADYHVYAFHNPPEAGGDSRQKIWVHRRKMLDADFEYFMSFIDREGEPHRPNARKEATRGGVLHSLRVAVARVRGRYPGHADVDREVPHGLKD